MAAICSNYSVYDPVVEACLSVGPSYTVAQMALMFYSIFLPASDFHTQSYRAQFVGKMRIRPDNYTLPIIYKDGIWQDVVGNYLFYTNFLSASEGPFAYIDNQGLWHGSNSYHYPVIVKSKPITPYPTQCLADGAIVYRFLCYDKHRYSRNPNAFPGCSAEPFLYTQYGDKFPSTDAYIRTSKEYNGLFELFYVKFTDSNGYDRYIMTLDKSQGELVESLGYCSPEPCVYGATFPIYWIQAHLTSDHEPDDMFTASPGEVQTLNTDPNFMGGRYYQGLQGAVCHLWTQSASFNCSFCTTVDPVPVIRQTYDYLSPLIFLLTIVVILVTRKKSAFYSVGLLFIIQIQSVNSCTVADEYDNGDYCVRFVDISMSPTFSAIYPIPSSIQTNSKLCSDISTASAFTSYPVLDCVFLPLKYSGKTLTDMSGKSVSYSQNPLNGVGYVAMNITSCSWFIVSQSMCSNLSYAINYHNQPAIFYVFILFFFLAMMVYAYRHKKAPILKFSL